VVQGWCKFRDFELLMQGYNTVTAFFEESGKFKDHKVISFAGVAGFNEESHHSPTSGEGCCIGMASKF